MRPNGSRFCVPTVRNSDKYGMRRADARLLLPKSKKY